LNLKGVNLYLIGMMGVGKTTVGRLLAEKLNYRFFDTDALIERLAGQPITQIFAEAGEPEFRRLESQVLAELSAYKKLVIATGGGVVLERLNWSYLQHGIVVWLDVPVEQLYSRLRPSTTRPLLLTAEPLAKLQELLAQRQDLYAQADVQVTAVAKDNPEQVATRVMAEVARVLPPAAEQSTPANPISSED